MDYRSGRRPFALLFAAGLLTGACGGTAGRGPEAGATGGGAGGLSAPSGSAGSTAATGGATGGSVATGGAAATGGSAGTAGAPATGGTAGPGTGGAAGATGGATGGHAGAAGGAGGTAPPGTGGAGGGSGGATGCAVAAAGNVYLDAAGGDDAKDGMSPATAWKTLAKVNGFTFQPGSHLCLKGGSTWTGQLWPKGSGSAQAPIVVDQYGGGARPVIAAGASDADAFHLLNQQYWEINDLEITNQKATLGQYRGMSINGQNGGTLNHIYIRNCFVHDVTGQVDWIGGDTANDAPGITFQTGFDQAKKTGGIVFDVQAGTGAAVKTRFNDVLVENNLVQDCSFGGIIFKQLDGSVHWGTRTSASDTAWTPHTNVVIRGNYVSQRNTKYGCDGIYLTNAQAALIEKNVVDGAGTSAIELYDTDAVTVQHNETFGTVVKAGGADSNGVDTDKATTQTIIQYNYFHENGDGILICQLSFGDSIIRYNVLQNNHRYQLYLHSDPAASSAIYNNTIYNDAANSGLAYGYSTSLNAHYTLTNNIFFAAAGNGVLSTSGTIVYQNNLYAGASATAPAGDTKAVKADPKLVGPGKGGTGTATTGPALDSLGGYKLQPGSPALNGGAVLPNNGGSDFWGDPLYSGAPDIGADEAP